MKKIQHSWIRLKERLKKMSLWTLFAVFSFVFLSSQYSGLIYWKYQKTPFFQDANQYYSYLPSLFIHHEIQFHSPAEYWLIPTPNGKVVPKMSMGVAIMEAPMFLIGDWIANHHDYPPDGYSPPYIWTIYFGTILYVFFGLWFLYKTLIMFFKPLAALLTVFSVFYATNLLYYTVSLGQMSHSFLFTLYCFFLYTAAMWYKEKRKKHLYLSAFLGGLIFMARPVDGIIFLLLPLMGVYNIGTLKSRVVYLWSLRTQLLIAILLFFVIISPQLIYWKINSGSFIFDAYIGEKFFFTDPQVINFLFSYRKGLFLYTPIMLLAFIGFIPLYRKQRSLFLPVLAFTVLNIYLLSCWWDWTFSGSFGCRAMVQNYALLALPLCAFYEMLIDLFQAVWAKTVTVILLCSLIYCFFSLNLTMTKGYNNALIHYSGMTKEAYWFVFNKERIPAEDWPKLNSLFRPMDIKQFRAGHRN